MSREDDQKKMDVSDALRRRAEEQATATATDGLTMETREESERLVHELRVHQIELEMQNEELRSAQLALDASRRRYFDLYDLAPVGYVTLSERSLIIDANLAACTMLGVERSAIVKQPLSRFILDRDQDLYYSCHNQLVETGAPQTCELRIKRPKDAPIWTRIDAVKAGEHEGESPACRITLSDITEEKRLTAQVALADRLSNLGLLAASMGHEVNNPLTYVLYNTETLAEELTTLATRLAPPDASTAQEETGQHGAALLKDIHTQLGEMAARARSAAEGAGRIREIVKGLRAFSRVDEELIEPLSVNGLVEAALTMVEKEIGARARVVRDFGAVPKASVNQGQMCQVFLNLLINAAHSIEEGDVDDNEIKVRTYAEGGHVVAEISDTGAGISDGNLHEIFDPFFTTKPIGSGTGLGLSICMKIVTALGGTLTVESKVGVGSTFTVRLPALPKAADSDRAPAPKVEDIAEGEVLRGRILIIDDESLVRNALVRMLKNHDTVVAACGTDARDILTEDTAFDVILCDLMMPDLSGMELFAWLKQRDPATARRVVFITGGAFTPKTQAFLSAENPTIVNKPFNVPRLQAILATLIQRARRDMSAS